MRSLSTGSAAGLKRHRTLLLTFDAFDTLFFPNPPVAEQYAAVAHSFGLKDPGITPQNIAAAFKDVYPAHAKLWPNYGRTAALQGKYGGPRQWWEEVIGETFQRARGSNSKTGQSSQSALPTKMVDALIDRFAGNGGYALFEDVLPFFDRMRSIKRSGCSQFDRVIIGIISNSDDRVPAVLESLGLRVGPTRATQDAKLPGLMAPQRLSVTESNEADASGFYDFDFVVTSYEAGEGKPHRLIFDIASQRAEAVAKSDAQTSDEILGEWLRVHVGDEIVKDFDAARGAGWVSYLVDRHGDNDGPHRIRSLLEVFPALGLCDSL